MVYVEANKRREHPKMEAELNQRLDVLARYRQRLARALASDPAVARTPTTAAASGAVAAAEWSSTT